MVDRVPEELQEVHLPDLSIMCMVKGRKLAFRGPKQILWEECKKVFLITRWAKDQA